MREVREGDLDATRLPPDVRVVVEHVADGDSVQVLILGEDFDVNEKDLDWSPSELNVGETPSQSQRSNPLFRQLDKV